MWFLVYFDCGYLLLRSKTCIVSIISDMKLQCNEHYGNMAKLDTYICHEILIDILDLEVICHNDVKVDLYVCTMEVLK